MAGGLIPLYRNYDSSDGTMYKGYSTDQPLPDAATLGWSKAGYVMAEWNSNRDGTGNSYAIGIPPTGTVGQALYAIWQEDVTIPYIATNKELKSIANAIRTKGGTSAQLSFPTEFVSAIQAIQTGITPTGTKQITLTDNGTTTEDVTNYASAQITVAIPVYNGEIVTPYNVTISLTNPRHESKFVSFKIYEMSDESTVGNEIGSIDSASGSTQVSVSTDMYGIRTVLTGDGVCLYHSNITVTGGVIDVNAAYTLGVSGPLDFSVDGDGTITIDKIDWSF